MAKLGGAAHGIRAKQRWLVRFAAYASAVLATIVLGTIATRLLVPPDPSPWHDLVLLKNLILPILLFAIYAVAVRFMEHRRSNEIEFRQGLPTFVLGILIGSTIIAARSFSCGSSGSQKFPAGRGFPDSGANCSPS